MDGLSRLAADLPHLGAQERVAQATYLVLRQKYAEALPLLETAEEPLVVVGWSYGRGLVAKIYNELGEHAKAEGVCAHALGCLQTADLEFVPFTLALQTELAIARAGLGRFDEAEDQLQQLLQDHADKGPLALGWLHRTCARVAQRSGDLECAAAELERMDQHYRATNIPSLQRLSAELRRELRQERLGRTSTELPLTTDDGHLITRIHLVLTSDTKDVEERSRRALKIAVELGGAAHGFIVYPDRTVIASSEHVPSEAAIDWAHERLEAADEDEAHTAISDAEVCAQDETLRGFDGANHRLCFLWRRDGSPVAVLVLASEAMAPELPPSAVLRVISDGLAHSAH